ncbi:hypothetical protein Acr_18g0012120 [Actinidia rufa]|uniref:Uncharacterized protein n=1 Tax=Actinidia rufa TaxID=165716 RepID=A0A7J0G8I6_9ERIC|nr:hypothetical protein Acr_18g0012120 [Actinidia rufa]
MPTQIKIYFLMSLFGFRVVGSSKLGMMCKESIRDANNKQESRDVTAPYVRAIYRHTIPCKAAELIKESFPSLCIKGWALQHEAFNLKRSSDNLRAHWPTTKLSGLEEGVTSSSLSHISLDPINSEEEEEEFVREVENVGPSSIKVDTMRFRNLKKKTMLAIDPTITVPPISQTSANESQHQRGPCMGRHAAKQCRRSLRRGFRDHEKFVSDAAHLESPKGDNHIRSHGGAVSRAEEGQEKATQLQPKLKARLMLPMLLLLSFKWWRVALYTSKSLIRASCARDNYAKQVTEVRSEAFLEGFLAFLSELDIFENNPMWSKAAPTPEFTESSTPYSPMVLPSFDKEEYANRTEEDEGVAYLVITLSNKAAHLSEEAKEKTTKEVVEGASRDPPPQL